MNPTYAERERRLVMAMENRTEYNDGMTMTELCKQVLDYDIQVLNDKEKMHILSSRAGTDEEQNDIAGKWFEDKKKVAQINRMLKRTREKYRPGTRYNDTNLKKHQYYLLPPRLQQEDKQWRCVHIIAGINGHLLNPLLMRQEKYISTHERITRKVVANAERSDEEREKLRRKHYTSRLLHNVKKVGKDLVRKLKSEKRLPRSYKSDFERISLVFETQVDNLMQKYGEEIRTIINDPQEKSTILTQIIIADYEKKQYILKYDWELLDYLKRK